MSTSPADWHSLYLGFAIAAIAVILALVSKPVVLEAPSEPATPRLNPATMLTVLLGSVLLYAIMANRANYLIGLDEYFRASYAFQWARDRFFATQDHIWLPGQFYILGVMFDQTGNMSLSVTITSLLGFLATVYLSARIAFLIWQHQVAAIASAFLVAGHWVVLWGALNPIAEVFSWPCLLLGLERFLWGWIDATPGSRKRELAWVMAAVATGCGTMFRFEGWYSGIVLGCFFCVRVITAMIAKDWKRFGYSLLSAIIIASYPVAYLISSWRVLGSPIAFLIAGAEMNAGSNLFYDLSSPLSRFLIYPNALLKDHWNWLPVPLAAILLLIRKEIRARLAPLLVSLSVLLLFSMLVTMRSGVGSNLKQRYTMFLLIPILSLAGGPVRLLWEQRKGGFVLKATLGAWLVLTLVGSMKIGLYYYPNAFATHPDDLEIVSRIQNDGDESRVSLDYPRIQPKGKYLLVYAQDLYPVIRYHAPGQKEMLQVKSDEHLKYLMNTEKEGRRFLLRKPIPAVNYPRRVAKVLETGSWEVWEVRGSKNATP